MSHERIAQFADEATATLAADPELRLEARAGLLAQVEERREGFHATGHDEEESSGLALAALGDAREMAGRLLVANKWRMLFRALSRRFICWVLLPAAVIIAVVVGYRSFQLIAQVQTAFEWPRERYLSSNYSYPSLEFPDPLISSQRQSHASISIGWSYIYADYPCENLHDATTFSDGLVFDIYHAPFWKAANVNQWQLDNLFIGLHDDTKFIQHVELGSTTFNRGGIIFAEHAYAVQVNKLT